MDSSFWYGLLVAVLSFFNIQPAEIQTPAWLQQGIERVRESSREQVQAQAAERFDGRVTAVSDGDSLRITDNHGRSRRVRLAYVDAPELQQAGGAASRDALRRLADGQNVQVWVFEQDAYRRDVVQVWVGGQDAGLTQIEGGHAWHYASYAKRGQSRVDYAEYAYQEALARRQRRGLWQAQDPQAPWAYRKAQRAAQQPASRTDGALDALW